MLLQQEEVTWKTIIYDLIQSEQMDPWDINITHLTEKYISVIKEMHEHDLKISGKILLAAAVMLRLKSTHLIENDFAKFDLLMNQDEGLDEDVFEELSDGTKRVREKFQLIPRQPQPRNRKVSIHDLVKALQTAMETKKKILAKYKPTLFEMPKRGMDIMGVIRDMYHKITYYSEKEPGKELSFTQLLPAQAGRREKVYSFIPLLHLENQQKIETTQKEAFDEIYVKLLKNKNAS